VASDTVGCKQSFCTRPSTFIYNWCNSFFQTTNREQKYWCSPKIYQVSGVPFK